MADKIGVVGAGVMGRGLAQALAQGGFDVLLVDLTTDILDEARRSIGYAVKSAALFDPELRNGHDGILARITATTEYAALARVDFVIENTTRTGRSRKRFIAIWGVVAVRDVSLQRIPRRYRSRGLLRPHRTRRVIGMHFMNPVSMKPLVEVIPSTATSEDTIAAACALVRAARQAGDPRRRQSPGSSPTAC
ncbi:MAG: 3-hydroxyacyl-CoA dehydrogenase NAD-binding domain-containing protein [Sphingomonas sp.]